MNARALFPAVLLGCCLQFSAGQDVGEEENEPIAEEGRAEAEQQFAKETYKRLLRDLKKSIEADVEGNETSYEQQALDTFEEFEASLKAKDWQRLRNYASNLQNLRSRDPRRRKDFSVARRYLEDLRKSSQSAFVEEAVAEVVTISDSIRGLLRADVAAEDLDAIEGRARRLARQLEVLGYDDSGSSTQAMTNTLRWKSEALLNLRPIIVAARSGQPQVAAQRLLNAMSYQGGNQAEFTPQQLREFGVHLLGRENAVRHSLIAPANRAELKWLPEAEEELFPAIEDSSSSRFRRNDVFRQLDEVFVLVEQGQPEGAAARLVEMNRNNPYGGTNRNLPVVAEAQRVVAQALLGDRASPARPDDNASSYLARLLAEAAGKEDYAAMESVVLVQERLAIGENHAARLEFLRAMQLGESLVKIGQTAEAARAYRVALEKGDTCGVESRVVLGKLLALHQSDPTIAITNPPAQPVGAPVTPEATELRVQAIRYQILELGKQLEALSAPKPNP